jgi:hypothetical protein
MEFAVIKRARRIWPRTIVGNVAGRAPTLFIAMHLSAELQIAVVKVVGRDTGFIRGTIVKNKLIPDLK